MDWIIGLLTTIAIFVAALFILVFIHELGHFLAAKFFKMRVDRFSIGFPPKIFGIQKGETEYVIGATPLGGYVKIAGMIDESMDDEFMDEEPKPWEFRSKPVWQRIIVITAGVIFNVILAAVIYAGMAMHYGEEVIPVESVQGIYVPENSLAAEMGFQTGDQLIGINGRKVDYFDRIMSMSAITERDVRFMVNRNGSIVELNAPADFLDRVGRDGFVNIIHAMPGLIGQVQPNSPAEKAGLQKGDRVLSVNDEPVDYWLQLVEKIQSSEGELVFEIQRNGQILSETIQPEPESKTIGIQLANPAEYFESVSITHNLISGVGVGFSRSGDTFTGIIQGLVKMFTGDISVRENLGGPVAIANVTKQATDSGGMRGFWEITAFLSITLAIMNMLPIPALDGGHFMFLVYEGITRREPSAKVRMALQQIGFILIIGLFIFVTFNDILRTFGG
ncbi:MAG: RIP metalloprotease RseP [Balneolaceae bacterium]